VLDNQSMSRFNYTSSCKFTIATASPLPKALHYESKKKHHLSFCFPV